MFCKLNFNEMYKDYSIRYYENVSDEDFDLLLKSKNNNIYTSKYYRLTQKELFDDFKFIVNDIESELIKYVVL